MLKLKYWKLLCTHYKGNGHIKWEAFQSIKNPYMFMSVFYDDDGNIVDIVNKDNKTLVLGITRGTYKDPNSDIEHTTYKCPNCGCTIHLDWHEQRNYCPECGIKLDWSEIHKTNQAHEPTSEELEDIFKPN